jgi:hypothetical protein
MACIRVAAWSGAWVLGFMVKVLQCLGAFEVCVAQENFLHNLLLMLLVNSTYTHAHCRTLLAIRH